MVLNQDSARAWALLARVRALYEGVLGNGLTGIYVHGSLAAGCFTWKTGDIDFLAVTETVPTDVQKEALIKGLLELSADAPPKGLEMSIVLRRYCERFVYPTPYELHFSPMHAGKAGADTSDFCRNMNGTDFDLAAHFTVIKSCGITLCGVPIDAVFAPIPREYYIDSIMRDIEDAACAMTDNGVYHTLNLSRTLGYLLDGKIRSKREGGEWALTAAPLCYHPIIEAALASYAGETVDMPCDAELEAFRAYMMGRIEGERRC